MLARWEGEALKAPHQSCEEAHGAAPLATMPGGVGGSTEGAWLVASMGTHENKGQRLRRRANGRKRKREGERAREKERERGRERERERG
ncbi:unnamed protein product [Closterium sp. NIES-54]